MLLLRCPALGEGTSYPLVFATCVVRVIAVPVPVPVPVGIGSTRWRHVVDSAKNSPTDALQIRDGLFELLLPGRVRSHYQDCPTRGRGQYRRIRDWQQGRSINDEKVIVFQAAQ